MAIVSNTLEITSMKPLGKNDIGEEGIYLYSYPPNPLSFPLLLFIYYYYYY